MSALADPCDGSVWQQVGPSEAADLGDADAEQAETDGDLVSAALPGAVSARRDQGLGFGVVESAGGVSVLDLAVGGWVAAAQDRELFVQVEVRADSSAVTPAQEGAGEGESVADAVVRQVAAGSSCPVEYVAVAQVGGC